MRYLRIMKSFLVLWLLWPLLAHPQNQQMVEALIQAEVAADSCEQGLPAAEKSYSQIETSGFEAARDLILQALANTEYSLSLTQKAYEQTRSVSRMARKKGCLPLRRKVEMAMKQLQLARQEMSEARDQLLLIERQWLLIQEERSDNAQSFEYAWANSYKEVSLNTARLAILNSYTYLQMGRIALQEAQLALC